LPLLLQVVPVWNGLDASITGWYGFMIGQAVEGYILQPFLLGDKIGLSPVAVVFAVLAGAQLAGFLGMLIALPVAAVIVVLLKHLEKIMKEVHLCSIFYISDPRRQY
jgi:predicted PurR-regulated permease PerM